MADVGGSPRGKGFCFDLLGNVWQLHLATSGNNILLHDLAIFFREPGGDSLLPVLLTIKPKAEKE